MTDTSDNKNSRSPLPEDTAIYIASEFRLALTPGRLLASSGVMLSRIPDSAKDTLIFRSTAPGYVFEAEILNGRLFLRRNGNEVSVRLAAEQQPPSPPGPPPTWLNWRPTTLQLATVLEKAETATPASFVPHALLDWAQRESISPVLHYDSPQDFFGTIVAALVRVQEKIAEVSMQGAFWDETRGPNGKIEKRVPKREVEIQPTIEGLLRDVGIAKSFTVLREATAAGGALDFYFVGSLRNGGVVGACMELKHAHSDDIFNGLERQLPAYMTNKRAEFGVYGVLWFKCAAFNEPTPDKIPFHTDLLRRLVSLPYRIAIEVFDLTRPPPPSKL